MADPITLGLLGLGVARAGAGIAQGIGQVRAARAAELTPQQEAELRELRERQRRGELGLTEAEEGALRRQFETAQMGAARDLQGLALTQQAAQVAGGRAISGREIFLQEQAEQQALRTMQQQEQTAILQAEQAAEQEQRARIAALETQQQTAEAALRAARAATVAGALGGAADVGSQALQMAQQSKLADAAVPKLDTRSVALAFQPQPVGRSFGGLVPNPLEGPVYETNPAVFGFR